MLHVMYLSHFSGVFVCPVCQRVIFELVCTFCLQFSFVLSFALSRSVTLVVVVVVVVVVIGLVFVCVFIFYVLCDYFIYFILVGV